MDLDSSDLLSALVGATAGSILTYYGSARLEQRKRDELVARLHCIFISEIIGHEVSFFSELNYILTAWLRRDDPMWREGNQLPFKPKYNLLSTTSFDEYRDQIVFSPLAVPLTTYYQTIKGHNIGCERLRSADSVPNYEVASYIRSCKELLDGSTLAIEDLLKTRYAKKFFTPLLENAIKKFRHSKQEHLYIAVLAKFKYERLEEWEQEIDKAGAHGELPSPLNIDRGASC